jgi:putative ABC transport system permease protein
MLFWTTVKVGLKSLLANKMRSLLTMLGIIIGVGAVISMLAMGAGAKQQIMQRISAMGTNLLYVRPNQIMGAGVRGGMYQTLKLADATAILAEVENIHAIAPVADGNAQVKFMNQNSSTPRVTGTSPTYLQIRNFLIEQGRCFTDPEVDGGARVCVLGPQTATDLFGEDEPLGQTIKIKSLNFRVVGVLKSKGDQGWFNPDDNVFVPYTVAMQELFGLEYVKELDIQADEGSDLYKVQDDVTALLRKRHHLQSDQPEDFQIRNQADTIQMATETSQTFTILLGGIASISLLVGGIGIMNIMLVTVTERTKEIGIRKAIGAKERSILLQFLLEAIIISGLGGLLGVVLGVGGAYALSRFTQFATLVTPLSILLSLSFSGMIGVFFGFYPARRAASMDPVEALRYE